jgi:hypothetical protein
MGFGQRIEKWHRLAIGHHEELEEENDDAQ